MARLIAANNVTYRVRPARTVQLQIALPALTTLLPSAEHASATRTFTLIRMLRIASDAMQLAPSARVHRPSPAMYASHMLSWLTPLRTSAFALPTTTLTPSLDLPTAILAAECVRRAAQEPRPIVSLAQTRTRLQYQGCVLAKLGIT